MEFRLLGPVECLVEGVSVVLRRPQERCLLAVLLLVRGQVVALDRLTELLWDGAPPDRARSIVHTHVSRLRAALRQAGAEAHGVRILTRGRGYAIEAPESSVDVFRFRALVERARATPDPAARAALLRDALALWRGAPLADAATERVRDQICAGLDEQRISALEDRAEADLAAGRHRELTTELTNLAARYPLRERLIGLLMLALYRSGQQAAALTVYGDTRRRLVEELGIEPGGELRALQRAILTQDHTLDGPPAGLGAQSRPRAVWRGRRSHLTAIVGRDKEFVALGGLLGDHRMVTVVGTGGVGKTTLALHVAESVAPRLGRDVAVVALAPLRTQDEIVLALGAVLEVRAATMPETLAEVERAIDDRPHLLVLDNCEHLAAECADVVRRLLAASPGLLVLATSRAPIGLPEETVWPLEPLRVPAAGAAPEPNAPAMALFLRRAGEALPGFTPSAADLAAAGRICRRVDGLPLALELAASRLRAVPTGALADALDHGFELLAPGAGRGNPLTATLDWSYGMLGADERRLLARLSVFRGGFDAAAAERVCGADPLQPQQVLPTLARLLDRSLVQPYDVAGVRRYRLLEVVRDYAATKLASCGEARTLAGRHLDYWLERARTIISRPLLDHQLEMWVGMVADGDNLRAAADHGYAAGRVADAVELVSLLFDFWALQDIGFAELERSLEGMRPHLSGCPPRVRSLALFNLALLHTLRDDYVGALEIAEQALPDLRVHHHGNYLELRITTVRSQTRALNPDALPAARELYETLRVTRDPHHRVHAVAMLAEALITWGRYEEAALLCAAHESAHDAAGPTDVVRFLVMRCLAALGQGDLDGAAAAEDRLRDQLGRPSNFLHHATPATAIVVRAQVALAPQRARTVIAATLRDIEKRYPPALSRSHGFRIRLAEVLRRAGDPERARDELTTGLAAALTSKDFTQSMPGITVAALLAADLGDATATRELAGRWDRLRGRLGLPAPIGFTRQVADELGLDPAAPPATSGGAWDPAELAGAVAQAHAWCSSGFRVPARPRNVSMGRSGT